MQLEAADWSIQATPPVHLQGFTPAGGQNLTHFDGSSWTAVSHPVAGNVYKVWGSSSSDIYAATATAILHYDGTTWSSSAGCAQQCIAVGGTSSTDVYVAGDGPLRRFDGSIWSDIAPNPGVRIEGLFGLATNSVYFVGLSGTACCYVRGLYV